MNNMKFKVVCLNLWLGGTLFDNILSFLKKENPDILACQEVLNGKDTNLERQLCSVTVLQKELNFPYTFSTPAYSETREEGMIESGNAIFSRFPILGTKTIFYDIPYAKNYIKPSDPAGFSFIPRNLQQAVLEIGKAKLNFFNTQGIWGADGKDNERRLKMADIIVEEIKDKENVILTGDFNVNEGTRSIAKIGERLKSVFANELTNTFNMKRKDNPGYASAVVDMIFVSKNIKILEHYCPQVDVSDHLPLVCVCQLNQL